MATDLVCGMNIDEKKSGVSYKFKGQTYYFCGSACKDQFEKSPDRYIKKG